MSHIQAPAATHALMTLAHHLRHLRHRMARQAGLNYTEYELLANLHHQQRPMSVKEMSQSLFLCSQAVTKITKSLIKRGFVLTHKSETDKRITYITPTAAATTLTEEEASIQQMWIASNRNLGPEVVLMVLTNLANHSGQYLTHLPTVDLEKDIPNALSA